MKIGLIMEGGGMSGVFTAGVMDVLMRNKITFDGAIGVSAGAIFGVNIKSEQIGRVIRFNKKGGVVIFFVIFLQMSTTFDDIYDSY